MGVILLSDPAMFISIFISMFIYVMGGGGFISIPIYQNVPEALIPAQIRH